VKKYIKIYKILFSAYRVALSGTNLLALLLKYILSSDKMLLIISVNLFYEKT